MNQRQESPRKKVTRNDKDSGMYFDKVVTENLPPEDADNNNDEDTALAATPVEVSPGTGDSYGETRRKKRKGDRVGKQKSTTTTKN